MLRDDSCICGEHSITFREAEPPHRAPETNCVSNLLKTFFKNRLIMYCVISNKQQVANILSGTYNTAGTVLSILHLFTN